ncbi:hypothetical protein [Streptomyces sp. CMB-StM0423]|uniref:hypothetical protein n=1 Tax=Streptomyces sp. CMB-StM0423 TaxID=2059884 RepID=UPI000C71525C|nr:hypothetical protein [Streptomyces sp. CMB-StM0423]AUH41793.1 hypothetical protein CXR04_17650 [Streptomyces sp. CMB-StM0423]
MSERWGLIVEETDGLGDRKSMSANVLENFTGPREEAMARLETHARAYRPQHPANSSHTSLYRTGEGFLLISKGSLRSYGCRFSLAELLYDSREAEQEAKAARQAERDRRAAEKAEAKAAKRAERKARRLP